MFKHYFLLLLISTGSLADCGQDGKVSLVKEIASYDLQSNCTVKCSMYCEADEKNIGGVLPCPSVTIRDESQPGPTRSTVCPGAAETVTVTVTVSSSPSPLPVHTYPTDCKDALNRGFNQSGVYTIQPDSLPPFDVYCDMDTNGGGWTVFQRRQDGSVSFYQPWDMYVNGFGHLSGEFWLGLNYTHRLTSGRRSELRVDLKDFDNKTAYAQYNVFAVGDAASMYTLSIDGYSGTAGDALPPRVNNNIKFSTIDRDNDNWALSCALRYRGGWWYNACHFANLNGHYRSGYHHSYADGVNWRQWRGYHYSLKFTEMKLRALE